MRASFVRKIAMAGLAVVALSGCGRMPSLSTNVPNWPQGSSASAEETRATREAELAKYKTSPQENSMTALASNAIGMGPGSTAPSSAPARKTEASTVSTGAPARRTEPSVVAAADNTPQSAGKFEVAPELMRQPPAPRQAPAREMLASAAPTASNAPQASRYGDLVFISGQLPLDARGQPAPADARIEDQARLALENVRTVLESQRLSMANVVSMTVYLRDLNDMRAFEAEYAKYFKGAQPARSVVEVSKLPHNARIEISAVAGR